MGFQTGVNLDQASGIVGDIAFKGPMVALRYILQSGTPANNIFGRAFTFTGTEREVTAGGTGPFAGIMAHPKQHALEGTSAGTLEPSLTLPNDAEADFLKEGYVFVELTNAHNEGDSVAWVEADGTLVAYAPTDTIAASQNQIPGAKVITQSASSGLAVIKLTDQQTVNAET